jgi:hypothetical protein
MWLVDNKRRVHTAALLLSKHAEPNAHELIACEINSEENPCAKLAASSKKMCRVAVTLWRVGMESECTASTPETAGVLKELPRSARPTPRWVVVRKLDDFAPWPLSLCGISYSPGRVWAGRDAAETHTHRGGTVWTRSGARVAQAWYCRCP